VKLAFIGFGDLGRYVCDTIRDVHSVADEDLVYFDDNLHKSAAPGAFAFQDYANDAFADHDFYVCLGYRHLRLKNQIVERLVALGRRVPSFVHRSSYVHPTVKLGPGSWIYPGVNIDRNTVIGRASWIANGDVIPHDCSIGHGCWFGASVTLSGKVTVGDCTFIASGSTVSNDIRIGEGVIVGLATAVTKSIDDGKSVIGNPMRVLDRPLKLI
jgi:sugar O-acyltransferase (sialic acid O-acetyltransferase NeuD family)